MHAATVPRTTIPARLIPAVGERISRLLRSSGAVSEDTTLKTVDEQGGFRIEIDRARRGFRDIERGLVAGVRVDGTGQLSVWFPLPADTLGAVVDLDHVTESIGVSIGISSDVWQGSTGLAFGFEFSSVTMITSAGIGDLGHRSSAQLSGATRSDLRISPDEFVQSADWSQDRAGVAQILAPTVLRAWQVG